MHRAQLHCMCQIISTALPLEAMMVPSEWRSISNAQSTTALHVSDY